MTYNVFGITYLVDSFIPFSFVCLCVSAGLVVESFVVLWNVGIDVCCRC